MKKTYIILTIVFTLFGYSCSNSNADLSGNPSEVLDIETYNKLQKKYDSIKNFQKGTAIVVTNNKYGLINVNGKEVLSCIYDSISSFLRHYRIIKKDNLYGVVNIEGEIIKRCVFTDFKTKEKYLIDKACDYLALKLKDKWGFIDRKGDEVTQFKYETILYYDDSIFTAKYNGFTGVSDYKNNTLIPFKYDEVQRYMNNPATKVRLNEMYGLFNSKNIEVLPCEYLSLDLQNSGYVVATKYQSYDPNTKRTALLESETGKVIIPFEYINMGKYSEGLIACENLNNKYGYLNSEGNIVIPFIYDDAGDFSDGLAPVYKQSGYVNTSIGRLKDYRCGYIDRKGNTVIPFKFEPSISANANEFHDGLAAICYVNKELREIKYGFIDKKGDWVIEPLFDNVSEFDHGVAEVTISKKTGYINKKGDLIIPCIYDLYGSYQLDSIIIVKKDDKEFYFDLQGKPVDCQ